MGMCLQRWPKGRFDWQHDITSIENNEMPDAVYLKSQISQWEY